MFKNMFFLWLTYIYIYREYNTVDNVLFLINHVADILYISDKGILLDPDSLENELLAFSVTCVALIITLSFFDTSLFFGIRTALFLKDIFGLNGSPRFFRMSSLFHIFFNIIFWFTLTLYYFSVLVTNSISLLSL